jgi:anti-sigma B factor antagonist
MAIDPSGFSISAVDGDGRAVVTVRGELDLATAPELETALLERLDAGHEVVLDLRELQFMDSSGLRVLVTAHTRAADGGPRFAIVRPLAGSEVAKILEIAGIEQQLDVVDEP